MSWSAVLKCWWCVDMLSPERASEQKNNITKLQFSTGNFIVRMRQCDSWFSPRWRNRFWNIWEKRGRMFSSWNPTFSTKNSCTKYPVMESDKLKSSKDRPSGCVFSLSSVSIFETKAALRANILFRYVHMLTGDMGSHGCALAWLASWYALLLRIIWPFQKQCLSIYEVWFC